MNIYYISVSENQHLYVTDIPLLDHDIHNTFAKIQHTDPTYFTSLNVNSL